MSRAKRQAFTIVEVIAALAVLAVLFSSCLPILALLARQRSTVRQETAAMITLGNVLEKARVVELDSLTEEAAQTWAADTNSSSRKLDIQIKDIEIKNIQTPRTGKRVAATVTWPIGANGQTRTLRGVIWRFQ